MERGHYRFLRILVGLLVGLLVAAGCSAKARHDPLSTSVRITAAHGGHVRLEDAQIDLPPGALARDATVTITRRPNPTGSSARPAIAYQFDTGGIQLAGKVRLHLPVGQEGKPTRLGALAFLNEKGTWVAVKATPEPDGRVSAEVEHLSLWTGIDLVEWIGDRMVDVARLLHFRAEPPACPRRADGNQIAVDYPPSDLGQPPLWTCVEPAGDGSFRMTVVNNRKFAMTLEPDGMVAEPVRPLDSGALQHAVALLYSRNGTIVVPPGGEASFRLPAGAAAGSLLHRPSVSGTLAMIATALVADITDERFATDKATKIVDCARDLGNRLGGGLAAAQSAIRQCTFDIIRDDRKVITLVGALSVPSELVAAAASYVIASLKLAAPLLDAWADLTLYHAATGRVALSVPTHKPGSTPPPVASPASATSPQGPSASPAPPPSPAPSSPQPTPPPAPRPVVHYDCPNDNSNIGKYVPPGRYWENSFTVHGTRITGGWVLVGADTDGGDHRARVGIYSGSGHSGPLAEVIVAVTGYDGEAFSFPSPARVSPGQRLYLAASGVGDFTAYDNRSGCFIGRVNGST